MWKNGKTCSAAGAFAGGAVWPAMARPSAPMNRVFMMLVQWFRWVARAPFGMPVVPDVYMIVAWSSGRIGTSGSGAVRSSSPRSRSHARHLRRRVAAQPADDRGLDGEVGEVRSQSFEPFAVDQQGPGAGVADRIASTRVRSTTR